MQSAALIVFGMDPGTHRQLRNENVTTFGEKDWRFCRYHLDFGVGLHHLLNAGEGQLVNFVVMVIRLEVVDCMLPVRRQNISRIALKTLVDL